MIDTLRKSGMSWADIGKKLNRSPSTIKRKFKQFNYLGVRDPSVENIISLRSQGVTWDDIAVRTGLTRITARRRYDNFRNKATRIEDKNCRNCRKKFTIDINNSAKTMFCEKSCRLEFLEKGKIDDPLIIYCQFCDGHTEGKFCSEECIQGYAAFRESVSKAMDGNPDCAQCGQKFSRKDFRHTMCSDVCLIESHSQRNQRIKDDKRRLA